MKKLVIALGVLGALLFIGVMAVVSPGPAFKRQTIDAEPKLAYGRTIASQNKVPQPAAETPAASVVAKADANQGSDTESPDSQSLDPQSSDAQNSGPETDASADEAPSDNWEARVSEDETGGGVLEHGSDSEKIKLAPPNDSDPDAMAVPQDSADQPESAGADQPETTGALPQEAQEEWVQIVISGAEAHASAADDAPMLFALPYGRRLQVVSRDGGWVQVADPHSKATGWIKTAYLAPIGSPQMQQAGQYGDGYGEPYQDAYGYEPQRRGGWWRRQREGMSGMVNRALGGW